MNEKTCPTCGATNVQAWVVYIGADKPSICSACAAKAKYEQVAKLKVIRREKIPLHVGMTTLVGHIGFAQVIGPCPKCGHDHVADPQWSGHGNGREAICMIGADESGKWPPKGGCGAQLPVKDQYPMSRGNCCSLTHPYVNGKPTGPSYPCRNMHSENVDEAAKRWPELATGVEIEVLEDESCRVIDERLPAAWKKHYCSGCGYFEDEEEHQRYIAPQPPRDDKPRMLKTKWSSGETTLDPGYVFSPYIPVMTPPVVDAQDIKFLASRYKVSSPSVRDKFGKTGAILSAGPPLVVECPSCGAPPSERCRENCPGGA